MLDTTQASVQGKEKPENRSQAEIQLTQARSLTRRIKEELATVPENDLLLNRWDWNNPSIRPGRESNSSIETVLPGRTMHGNLIFTHDVAAICGNHDSVACRQGDDIYVTPLDPFIDYGYGSLHHAENNAEKVIFFASHLLHELRHVDFGEQEFKAHRYQANYLTRAGVIPTLSDDQILGTIIVAYSGVESAAAVAERYNGDSAKIDRSWMPPHGAKFQKAYLDNISAAAEAKGDTQTIDLLDKIKDKIKQMPGIFERAFPNLTNTEETGVFFYHAYDYMNRYRLDNKLDYKTFRKQVNTWNNDYSRTGSSPLHDYASSKAAEYAGKPWDRMVHIELPKEK